MVLNENDLVAVIEELRLKGYTQEFIIKNNLFSSKELQKGFDANEVVIDGAYRFDVTEDAFDTQYLFAVSIPNYNIKGLLIDLLGTYFYMDDQPITQILRNTNIENYIFDDHDPYLKYGLKKVTPIDFNQNTSRYILRIGFPDYPVCPVGSSFSMLGFDQFTKRYVWLSTSIIKDNRLEKIEYEEYIKK